MVLIRQFSSRGFSPTGVCRKQIHSRVNASARRVGAKLPHFLRLRLLRVESAPKLQNEPREP